MSKQGQQLQTIRAIVIIAVVIILIFYWSRTAKKAPANSQITTCGMPCGEERWLVKTLMDQDASKINFVPQTATVAWLVSQPAPSHLPQDSRIAPIETQTYSVHAQLVGYKLEKDHDIHIVIADLDHPDETMIVEIPSKDCASACASPRLPDFEAARAIFDGRFGEPHEEFRRMSATVDVTGVGFFDYLHRQTGVAVNGIELHPVLSIQFH
ncbi:MAG TPA: hypothetical protein VFO34_03470 [Candidatus Acidoferrales bacterium]|nr:hypothetical protein [Candidatus Acidoferrales bacterium]